MAQLTIDKDRTYKTEGDARNELPVKASTTIYRGSAVGLASGLSRQLVAGDVFAGFADAKAANVADPNKPNFNTGLGVLGADKAINVNVRAQGVLVVPVASVGGMTGNETDINKTVYMSDGDTFTSASTGNTKIGTIRTFLNGNFEIFFRSPLNSVA